MFTRAPKHIEAWLVMAAMLAATAWYARPQLEHCLRALRRLAPMDLAVLGGQQTMGCRPTHWITPACSWAVPFVGGVGLAGPMAVPRVCL